MYSHGRYKFSNQCNCTGYSSSLNYYSCGEIEISTQNTQNQKSIDQVLAARRNDLVLVQQKANEYITKTVDELSGQLLQAAQMLQQKDVEIKQLQGLCEKNKIDYKPKEPEKKKK